MSPRLATHGLTRQGRSLRAALSGRTAHHGSAGAARAAGAAHHGGGWTTRSTGYALLVAVPRHRRVANGGRAGLATHGLTRQGCRLRAALAARTAHHGGGRATRSAGHALLVTVPGHGGVADRARASLATHGLTRQGRGLRTSRRHAHLLHRTAHGATHPRGRRLRPTGHPGRASRHTLRHSRSHSGLAGHLAGRLARLIAGPGHGGVTGSTGAGLTAHGLAAHSGGLRSLSPPGAAHRLAAHHCRLGALPGCGCLAGRALVPGLGRLAAWAGRLLSWPGLSGRARRARLLAGRWALGLAGTRRRLIGALHHGNSALRRRRRTLAAHMLTVLGAEGRRLDTILAAHLGALLRRLLGGARRWSVEGGIGERIGPRSGAGARRSATRGGALLGHLLGRRRFNGGRLCGVFAAHDGGKVERLHLGCLIPGMATTGALQRPALLTQKLRR